MDIRQLHYFLVLCEEMNYTRASQRLFLSRQALRQSITALEAELCGPLFVSAHHKLSLTERGVESAAPCGPGGGAVPADAGGPPCGDPVGPAGAHRHQCLTGAGLPARAGDPAGQVPPAVPPH